MNIRNFLIAIIISVPLIGCGAPKTVAARKDGTRKEATAVAKELQRKAQVKERAAVKSSKKPYKKTGRLKKKLYTQYKEWKGVRYRFGGLNKKGVDCSGFVYLTFKSRLGKKIPRTTKLQSTLGMAVDKRKLRTGDLVFFKTSASVRHVGIYLEDGKFMHASKKRGVMISRLDNVYWRSKYWKARRIKL